MAFGICWNLHTIYFPSAIETGPNAFAYCYALFTVEFPELITLEYNSFRGCESLTYINFPKVTKIGWASFERCFSLLYADFPEAKFIDASAFHICSNMVYANFPKVTEARTRALSYCYHLTSISFGTSFEEETEIVFWSNVFAGHPDSTKRIHLTLGKYVLPKPNLNEKTWQKTRNDQYPSYPYIWASIAIYDGIEEKIDNEFVYYLGNNKYILENIEISELYDLLGNKIITFENEKIIDLNNLISGFYFLKYLTDDNKIKTKKLIIK